MTILQYIPHPSQNFNDRPSGIKIDTIIIHHTNMTNADVALERLCDPDAKVSAHYLIDQKGNVFQLVPDQHRAWHAGVSFWQGETNINCRSIGIELDYDGEKKESFLRLFPNIQIKCLLELLNQLCLKHSIVKNRIIGHSDIAPQRKEDPGENFPWEILHQHGYGLWPATTQKSPIPETVLQAQIILKNIGYNCPQHGHIDYATKAVIQAFQRHFLPKNITGKLCKGTQNMLKYF